MYDPYPYEAVPVGRSLPTSLSPSSFSNVLYPFAVNRLAEVDHTFFCIFILVKEIYESLGEGV